MNTFIRIYNINENIAEDIVCEFNRLVPGFCKGFGKHLLEKNLYSFCVSSDDDWKTHQEEIVNVLCQIGDSLLQLRSGGASWSINPCVHMYDYRGIFFVDFDFLDDLLQAIVRFGGRLDISVFTDDCPYPEAVCSPENGEPRPCPDTLKDTENTETEVKSGSD
jgi:hypothetical protein